MPASVAQSVGPDLRAGIRRCQLRLSARAIDEGCLAQSVEGDRERRGVDCGRRLERLFRVGGSRKTSYACGPTGGGWPGAQPDQGDAEGGKLRSRAALSERARDSARRGCLTLAQ